MSLALKPRDALALTAVRVPELGVAIARTASLGFAETALAARVVPLVACQSKAVSFRISCGAVDVIADAVTIDSVPVVG